VGDALSAFAALMSVIAVLVTAVLTYRLNRSERVEQADDLAARFREPLIEATHNLQSRLYNLVKLDFLARFLVTPAATPREREYAVLNTLFVFGQYLAWVEAIRREAQYVDVRDRRNNRVILERLEAVRDAMADSSDPEDRILRLFRGEQRAVGEVMLVEHVAANGQRRFDCLGYATFCRRLEDQEFAAWFESLREDIGTLASPGVSVPARVEKLQQALVDLLDTLDPDHHRVGSRWRERV